MRKIYAIAPGYPFHEASFLSSVKLMEQRGYRVQWDLDIQRPKYFHSNTDDKRSESLIYGLLSKDVDIVWAIRGGYGSNRLIPLLEARLKELKKVKPKIFLGLSDVTSLHLFLNQTLRWKTWHAPVFEALGRKEFPKEQLKHLDSILQTNQLSRSYRLFPLNSPAKSDSVIYCERLIGGNLTVFQSHIGTPLIGSLKGAALFFEDIGERGYRIDRALWQLRQARLMKDVKAVIFGEFTGGLEPDGNNLVNMALKRFASEVNKPVFWGIRSGHGRGYQSIPLGAAIKIQNQKLVLNP